MDYLPQVSPETIIDVTVPCTGRRFFLPKSELDEHVRLMGLKKVEDCNSFVKLFTRKVQLWCKVAEKQEG